MNQEALLIVGGLTSVGLHIASFFSQVGYKVVVLDALGIAQPPPALQQVTFIHGSPTDTFLLASLCKRYCFETVIYAGLAHNSARLSFNPLAYYHTNVSQTLAACKTLIEQGVKYVLVQSGIRAALQTCPIGRSLRAGEELLSDYMRYKKRALCIMRLTHVAGATPEEGIGSYLFEEKKLIPTMIHSLQTGSFFTVHGKRHETSDGTAQRDLVHPRDVAAAFFKAFLYLKAGEQGATFVLATGHEISIAQLCRRAEILTGKQLIKRYAAPRVWDHPSLSAHASLTRAVLEWQPRYSEVDFILGSELRLAFSS